MKLCPVCGAGKVYAQSRCKSCDSPVPFQPTIAQIQEATEEIRKGWDATRWRQEIGVQRVEFDVELHQPNRKGIRKGKGSDIRNGHDNY